MAIASLQTSGNNRDSTGVSFQNAAQAQHSENVAAQAAGEGVANGVGYGNGRGGGHGRGHK